MKLVKYVTFGCKVNQYETEVLREKLSEIGFVSAKAGDIPDFVVINSCAVTAEGERKMRQTLRRIMGDYPDAVVLLMGCVPQAFPEIASKLPAHIILGNTNIMDAVKAITEYSGERVINIPPHESGETFNTPSIYGMYGRTRAYIKIQDGCDRFCTYCIIPYARGRVRSKSVSDIQSEAEALANAGYSEIVLTGINLTAFGKDTGENFADAVKAAAKPDGIKRVRLGSLEPDHMTDELLDSLASEPKLCPHFHLSLQSGCDATLKRMNRHYDFAFYKDLIDRIRQRFSDCAFTTDVMVGFAGETDEDFDISVNNVLSIGFSKVHVFPYSVRPGTYAEKLNDHLTQAVKEKRSKIMIEATNKSRDDFLKTQLNKVYPVLFEQGKKGYFEGSTPNNSRVRVKSQENICGKIIKVKIMDTCEGVLLGEVTE